MSEDIAYSTVHELSTQIASKKLSPVELAKIYLARAEEFNPKTHVIVTLTRDHALKQAEQVEREIRRSKPRGPLHGIPYGVKDLLDTKGIRTTWGSLIFKDRVPDRDAAVIEKLNAAGAVLIAKLHTAEFAGGGPKSKLLEHSRNPWKLDRTTSGSSTGPGGATAGGMVGFSVGTETGGSIMSPSASCGVSGMRPTYGRVSRYGCMVLAWSLDKIGPLTRSAVDVGLVLEAIAGHDPRDPTSGPGSFKFRPDPGRIRGRRIGVHRPEFDAANATNRSVFLKALEVLRQQGFVLEDVELPVRPYSECYNLHSNVEGGSAFKALFNDRRIVDMHNAPRRADWMAASMLPASDYLKAQRLRQMIRLEADALLTRFDAVIAPTSTTGAGTVESEPEAPSSSGRSAPPRLTNMANLACVPGISVPCGFDADGLPLAIHIATKAWDEQGALDVAMAYQRETDWHRRRPTFRA